MTVTEKVSSLVETANRFPAIAAMLRGWDRSIVLRVDGKEIGIVTCGGQARVLNSPLRTWNVWFGLTEKTLDLLIGNQLSPLTAKLSGRLQSVGSIADILRFAAVFSACLQYRRRGYFPLSTAATASLASTAGN